jgi:hypothetical protein
MIVDILFQNNQDQSLNDQNTQILSAKDNFHVDLDVNVIDSNEQRVINNAQTDILRNADVVSNDVLRVESNVVTNKRLSSLRFYLQKCFLLKSQL